MKKSKQHSFNHKKNEDFEEDLSSFKVKRRKTMKNKYKKKRIKGYLDQDLFEMQ